MTEAIKINLYTKKNGDTMAFINGTGGVKSIGVQTVENGGYPARYGRFKLSKGQIKILDNLSDYIAGAEEVDFEPNAAHGEHEFKFPFGTVYVTNVATVCGYPVGDDGAYLLTKDNRLINLTQWMSKDD